MTTIPFGNDAGLTRAAAKVGNEKLATLNPCAEQEVEIARLKAEVARLRQAQEGHENDCAVLAEDYSVTETVNRLKADKARLVEALEFFADDQKYDPSYFLDALIQRGAGIARRVLKEVQHD